MLTYLRGARMSFHRNMTAYAPEGILSLSGHVLHGGGAHLVRVRNAPDVRAVVHPGATIVADNMEAFLVVSVTRSDCREWLNAACEAKA